MDFRTLLRPVLSLFDGGGEGGDGGNQGGTPASPASTQRSKNTGDTVLYGKQPAVSDSAAAGQGDKGNVTSNTLDERRAKYRELVKEYQDIYNEDFQRVFNRRFAETKAMQEQLEAQKPVIEAMQAKYKTNAGDMKALMQAVESDDAFLADAAEEHGMTIEQYKEFSRLQRENAFLLKQEQDRQARQRADMQLAKWQSEANDLKKLYPNFDLVREAENQEFLSLLKHGVPVQHAYEVTHLDQIKAGVAASQAAATEKQIVASVRAKGNRPRENGTSSQGSFVVKDNVHNLTKKDRENIARQVARGAIISF